MKCYNAKCSVAKCQSVNRCGPVQTLHWVYIITEHYTPLLHYKIQKLAEKCTFVHSFFYCCIDMLQVNCAYRYAEWSIFSRSKNNLSVITSSICERKTLASSFFLLFCLGFSMCRTLLVAHWNFENSLEILLIVIDKMKLRKLPCLVVGDLASDTGDLRRKHVSNKRISSRWAERGSVNAYVIELHARNNCL